jgi:hypothetical protein
MTYKSILYFNFLLFCSTCNATDTDNKTEAKDFNPVVTFVVLEALIGANSWMASEEPQVYGALGAILFPMVGCEYARGKSCTTNLIAVESLAIYNLSINPDKKSKNEIFKDNMIGWHLVMLTMGTTLYLDEKKSKKINLVPLPDGGGSLSFHYNF